MTDAQTHFDTGIAHHKAGRLQDALQSLTMAVQMNADNAAWWVQLGIVQAKVGLWDLALHANQRALDLNNTYADAAYNAGMCLENLGLKDQSLGYFELSFAMQPTADLAVALADTYLEQGRADKAAVFYKQGYALSPDDLRLLTNWAKCALNIGDMNQASEAYHHLVARNPGDVGAINTLLSLAMSVAYTSYSPQSRTVVMTCLKTPGVYTMGIARGWGTLVLVDPALVPLFASDDIARWENALDDALLCTGLIELPVILPDLEQKLTHIRSRFLMDNAKRSNWPKSALTFLNALSVQCFYNEYVFAETSDETAALHDLLERVKNACAAPSFSSEDLCDLALLGCYRPLHTVLTTAALKNLTKGQKYLVRDLIRHQLTYPETEADLKESFPAFGSITDRVSMLVREQYESKPYPRWRSTNLKRNEQGMTVDGNGLSVLIAGCGTGHEAVKYLVHLPKARVTAVDLSRTSMAYAKRKCDEYGFADRITFHHGSLLEIDKMGKTFDVISSSGVLHHLEDPLSGFKALAGVLKPQGRFHCALYSDIARQKILGPAWAYIRARGYTNTDSDIRAFRQDVLALPDNDPIRACTQVSDFFNLSECCDLLFHVQEHRMTLPAIRSIANAIAMTVMQVRLHQDHLVAYKAQHPADTAIADIDALDRYEHANPLIFLGMYPFWLRPDGPLTPHPVDPLISARIM